MSYAANTIHKQLRTELENYIKAQYFEKSPLLLAALSNSLDKEGLLYQQPYIESSPAYKSLSNGICNLNLPPFLRKFFVKLSEENCGVYSSPFVHQVQALEKFMAGEDLFVSTGTGSGKTECFMWPLLAKITNEAHESPNTWKEHGVRVIIMYPLNALVADQIGRLRKLIGDSENKFLNIFRDTCGNVRRPQFGMYTGRTPYPGKEPDLSQDRKLCATLEKITSPQTPAEQKFFEKLLAEGKIPVKANMKAFLNKLDNKCHVPDEEDAELITRFEMQNCCPDILITNYSMLEYMLLRPREEKIWNDTKDWLNSSSTNKLLFIIDEAHMYKGSSGGEVALLLRRLFFKLGITRQQVQFILTTASMPNSSEEDRLSVKKFFCNLTATDENHQFTFLAGERENLPVKPKYDIELKNFLQCTPDEFEQREEQRLIALNNFWSKVDDTPKNFSSMSEACAWLYEHIADYRPFVEMMRCCRGNAISLAELAQKIFPNIQEEQALHAVSILLAISPLARNDKGAVLFPVRMHMLFRGIKGIYACANENCPNAHRMETSEGTLTLGEIFLSEEKLVCPHCGGAVYELYNDRRCGTLFFKGYILNEGSASKNFLWRYPGQILDKRMKEIHLYIPPTRYKPPRSGGKTAIKPCYLDVKSGFIYFNDDSMFGKSDIRKLYYSEYSASGRPQQLTFFECPHCRHKFAHRQLTSFSTRGNQSFFNLINTQFQIQPAVPGKDSDPERLPNEGRKVLLFSDSRQKAATLARDMSKASDYMAAAQIFALAVNEMEQQDKEISLNELYGYFCLAAAKKNVRLFYGKDGEKFFDDCMSEKKLYERAKKKGKKYSPTRTMENAPMQMGGILLKLFCGGYNTLYDSAMSWLEPIEQYMENSIDDLEESYGIEVSDKEFLEIFSAWAMSICDENMALGHRFFEEIRGEIRLPYSGYGLKKNSWEFSKAIRDVMGWDKDPMKMKNWQRVLQENFLDKNQGDDKLYLDLSRLKVRFDFSHVWYRCERCGDLTPYPLKEHCPICGGDHLNVMTAQDLHALDFWRAPIESALQGGRVHVINTEEHTAQLSYKDQRDSFWSKTENYELRFQDFIREKESPVDILSSTTTMEVGIDIGSLIAVGLRNIPPMRENYQQRAGRAGRRGVGLSTIVTFCENAPHDALYFKNPTTMFRGDPRKPWIDVTSEKLIQRHLAMILFQIFLAKINFSLDTMSASDFLQNHLDNFKTFVREFVTSKGFNTVQTRILLPQGSEFEPSDLITELAKKLDELNTKMQNHPELFGAEDDSDQSNKKSLLDSLYEEGIIPTYSFPKNVVSTYIVDSDGNIAYQVERGLDMVISEYAPGRSIVVDKKTFQIGGIYYYGSERRKGQFEQPARKFIEDPNYLKKLRTCNCGWFGLSEENYSVCPFCGNTELKDDERGMLRPWGFAPKDAKEISVAQLKEEYSSAQPPIYSTLPEHDEMMQLPFCKNVRMASRKNQRVIMLNRGSNDNGFVICKSCGAAMPGKDSLKGVSRPYRTRFHLKKCSHEETVSVNLGYDFITDMLVLEFSLDEKRLNIRSPQENLWLGRAAQSVAEAFRFVTSKELDVDFSELITGWRFRKNSTGSFVDIYLYDNLSSGAGYSTKIATEIELLFAEMKQLMSECSCDSACQNCLKHYRNQYVQGLLDRHYGLNLLEWGTEEKIPNSVPNEFQKKYIKSLENVLESNQFKLNITNDAIFLHKDGKKFELIIYPAMLIPPKVIGKVYISEALFKYAKPYAIEKICEMCI